ncbi:MAG: ferritin-like domain-containing protein [Sporichthyaceae bacterium]
MSDQSTAGQLLLPSRSEEAYEAEDFSTDASAAAKRGTDIKALQTAASIENLAVAVYKKAATLDFIKDGNPIVLAFVKKSAAQHQVAANAFNSAAAKLGGRKQTKPNPKYAKVVAKALPKIKGPLDVVKLAITLEDVAVQTYTKNVGITSKSQRSIFAAVAAPGAQRRAVLLAVQALIKGGAADLIALPPKADKLPAAAGKVGFPDAYYRTDSASPVGEGAVK